MPPAKNRRKNTQTPIGNPQPVFLDFTGGTGKLCTDGSLGERSGHAGPNPSAPRNDWGPKAEEAPKGGTMSRTSLASPPIRSKDTYKNPVRDSEAQSILIQEAQPMPMTMMSLLPDGPLGGLSGATSQSQEHGLHARPFMVQRAIWEKMRGLR